MALGAKTLEKLNAALDYDALCQRYADGERYESLTPLGYSPSTIRSWMQARGHTPIQGRHQRVRPTPVGNGKPHAAVVRVAPTTPHRRRGRRWA